MDSKPRAIELLEGDYWKVLLNPSQHNLGQSLVVLKASKSSLAELVEPEWKEFGVIVKKFEEVVRAEFNPTHFNWQCLMNNAYEIDAKEAPHVHWHVSPRYRQPVDVEGNQFIDENYPRTNKKANILSPALLNLIAQRISL